MSRDADQDESKGPRRRRWFRRAPINLGELAVETIAVVLGILLALWINDWHHQRQQQAAVDEAMKSIRAELSTNRTLLRQHAEHLYGMARRMLASPSNRGPPRFCPDWDNWNGLNLPPLQDAAYQTSIATQAMANMPFEQAHEVARVYSEQHLVRKVYDIDGGMLLDRKPAPLHFCAGIAVEIGNSDMMLDRVYEALIGPDSGPRLKAPHVAHAASTHR